MSASMTHILFKNLTPRQRQAWVMRFRYGWRMRRIALKLGIKPNTVSELLQRAQLRAGVGRGRIGVIRTQPQVVRSLELLERDF